MVCGLFGAFILGFLGTAMPRMLSPKPLRPVEVLAFALVHGAMVAFFAWSNIVAGDWLFLILLGLFLSCMGLRAKQRKDLPPPGFVLVALAFLSVAAGTGLALAEHYRDPDPYWIAVQRLLSYQGFVLLPILGIGPFLLPRFFGMPNRHDFPESLVPSRDWLKKAAVALLAGILIVSSFFLEARGSFRIPYALRFGTTLFYLFIEMPFHRGPKAANALGASLRISFTCLVGGLLAVALFPAYRVSLLHLTLIGGFAVLAFTVATRVVFGHSGNLALLKGRNRWLLLAVGLMLFGMATRISGDFWPKILPSHYVYGALLWVAGVLLWAAFVLPKVFVFEKE